MGVRPRDSRAGFVPLLAFSLLLKCARFSDGPFLAGLGVSPERSVGLWEKHRKRLQGIAVQRRRGLVLLPSRFGHVKIRLHNMQ